MESSFAYGGCQESIYGEVIPFERVANDTCGDLFTVRLRNGHGACGIG
ncbi:MAG: hypothetical protein GY789_24295 [Hyphomicrobiales bacterium]|nr:hypothetical protein [Hyphomicrobiales bacterium]MCP4998881.1 hypothetical protein [Hyphomicrobiales bacterium]